MNFRAVYETKTGEVSSFDELDEKFLRVILGLVFESYYYIIYI